MVENGHKQALADAIAEARSEELARLAADLGNVGQLDLFGAVQSTQVAVVNGGSRGPGRPVGARNKRTDEAARFYMSRFGDPLSLFSWRFSTGSGSRSRSGRPSQARAQSSRLTEIARLVGKRLVTAAETDEGCRWDQQRMTTLTGRDEITANFMRQDQFSYYPRFLLMFHGNHRPRLNSDGGAMRRRTHLLPCRHRPVKIDKHLLDALNAELGGIMRWGVEGAVLWKLHGLMPPKIVVEATNDYFAAEDILGAWIEERCDQDKLRESETDPMYVDYKAWAKAANEFVLSKNRFSDALRNLGFRWFLHSRTRRSMFSGIALRSSNEELPM